MPTRRTASTPDLVVREATLADWPLVKAFFEKHYREGHPFRKKEYFAWLIEREDWGRSFLAVADDRAVASVGMNLGGGMVWMLTLFVEEELRGRGVARKLYALAREYGPLATTNVNRAGLGMYRNMGWIRSCDLQRFVAVNPREPEGADLTVPVEPGASWASPQGSHYWRQPGLVGAQLAAGNTAVRQEGVGGLRVIDLEDPGALLEEAWAAGYRWVDFMTSWNDPLCRVLEDDGWLVNERCPVPWLLHPVVPGSVARVSLLSEEPLPRDLIVRRRYCDHGRVGSLD
jgi:GNAT superfamily N-acetyltransferase